MSFAIGLGGLARGFEAGVGIGERLRKGQREEELNQDVKTEFEKGTAAFDKLVAEGKVDANDPTAKMKVLAPFVMLPHLRNNDPLGARSAMETVQKQIADDYDARKGRRDSANRVNEYGAKGEIDIKNKATEKALGLDTKGFEPAPDGGLRPTQGGPEDPNYLRERAGVTEKPTYQKITDDQGVERIVQISPRGGASYVTPSGGAETQPANPYVPKEKLTEGQAKDRAYLNRMIPSHQIITGLEGINEGPGGFIGGVAASNPTIRDSSSFNMMASADRQKVLQAQRDFVNAILRRESGAVINPSEFDNATRQYFPMPGDGPDVIKQKRENRMRAIEGMMEGAGRGYRPPGDYVGTKGPAQPQSVPRAAQPASQPTSPAATPRPAPPMAIQALKANPRLAEEFDAKYGPGAAARALGVTQQ